MIYFLKWLRWKITGKPYLGTIHTIGPELYQKLLEIQKGSKP